MQSISVDAKYIKHNRFFILFNKYDD